MTTLFIYETYLEIIGKKMADISYSAKINSKNLNDFFEENEEDSNE